MDVFSKCFESAKRTDPMHAAGVYTYYRVISSAQDPVVNHHGRDLVMLGSNNYLGLTNHREVKDAAATALALYGTGCAGSRLLNGTLDLHVELEERLAEFMEREAALTFSTGFQVNLGVLSCLLGPLRRRLPRQPRPRLHHRRLPPRLRQALQVPPQRHGRSREEARPAPADRGEIIVVDGVFSMEGDLAPLPRIVELKNRYGARLMVDDAHGLGVFGEQRARHAGALRRGRRGRPRDGHVLQVAGHRGRLRRGRALT